MNEIGVRIFRLREAKGMTQKGLSQKIGCSREVINTWENGTRQIKGKDITLLAEALGTTCDYLLQGKIEKEGNIIDAIEFVVEYTGLSREAVESIKKMDKSTLTALTAIIERLKK